MRMPLLLGNWIPRSTSSICRCGWRVGVRLVTREWRRGVVTVTKSGSGRVDVGSDLTRIRNVGVMAHIDAGKTTTTERFLYYSGVIATPGEVSKETIRNPLSCYPGNDWIEGFNWRDQSIGSRSYLKVHHGDTVTDFLPQERERGITIQSAVVSFNWKNHKINLIDTPGHVDFTFEVQRSLRVVDSAIAILDASAGVEAQTLTVWRQATDYGLPRLIFLNKMDKKTASVDMCMQSIVDKLKCIPILLQQPVYEEGNKGSNIIGVVDLVEMRKLIFDRDSRGAKIIPADVSNNKDLGRLRGELVEKVADLDSELADRVIETESVMSITNKELYSALRRLTVSNAAVPVLLGSSYKNVGVQPLLDALLMYSQYPGERAARDPVVSAYGNELCSFAFKTMHDKQIGPLTFMRIFSGQIGHGQKLYNVSRGKHEKIAKVYLPLADEITETNQTVGTGEVVIVSGLKDTFTGDTVSSSNSVSASVTKKLQKKDARAKGVLSGVNIPEPVFLCSVEPVSISQQKALEDALECLRKEDPSLHVYTDPDSNQMILSGMGELHMEIIHQRLKSDYKVEADLGKIQVAYKETISNPILKRSVFERKLADHNHFVCIELELNPVPGANTDIKIYKGRDKDKCENLAVITDSRLRHIQNGVESSLRFGPKLSFPVVDLEIILHWFQMGRGTSDTIIEAAAASCVRECLKESYVYLMEPMVVLEVTVDENYQRIVLDDLNRRRFVLRSVDSRHGNKVVTGTCPLSELMGYSTILRTLASGLGTFSMQFSHNQLVNNPIEEQKIMTSVRGF